MCVWLNPIHFRDVPIILNLKTRHISSKYHVVFNDDFSTVPSRSANFEPPDWWNTVDLEDLSLRIPLDDASSNHLAKDFFS